MVTVSDIADISGDHLDLSKWKGYQAIISSHTHGTSIYQQDRPSEREWSLWRRMCKALWTDGKGKLHELLGPWLLLIHGQHNNISQVYFESEQLCGANTILWVKISGDEYTRCIQTASPWVYHETTQTRSWQNLPPQMVPSTAELIAPELWNLWHYSKMNPRDGYRGPSATFEQFVSHLPEWEAELLQQVELSEHPFTVSDAMSHGIRAVSDGSVWTDNQGAFGWIISTDVGDRIARGMGPVRPSRSVWYARDSLLSPAPSGVHYVVGSMDRNSGN